MRVNKTYKALLEKSVASMLSAIEIYNKPYFMYREEAFSILVVNAWELLFKAIILKTSSYKMSSLYCYSFAQKKDGSKSKRLMVLKNRCGNPKTKSIVDVMKILEKDGKLPAKLKENVECFIELRDNSVHLLNGNEISRQIQELGFACIKNYITYCKIMDVEIDFSQYNFYLMPLAYVDEQKFVTGILNDETNNFINLVKSKLAIAKDEESNFDIAVEIELSFKKGNSFGEIGVVYEKNGVPIELKEEDIRKKYPLRHSDLVTKCKKRYSDFKQDKKFNDLKNTIHTNEKLCHQRKLDPDNPKTPTTRFYSSNVFVELDKHYTLK